MDLETKFDLILKELKNICCQIDDKFEKVDSKFEKIDQKFEQIDARFEQIDARFEQIDARFEQIDARFDKLETRFDKLENRFDNLESRFDNLEKRFDKFEKENKAEHQTMFNTLNLLNSAFLRFESEQSAKIDYLLEADKDRRNHQKIYAHEFTKLNDLIAQNTYRISNLEQHIN